MSRNSKRQALLEADEELDEASRRLARARAEIARVANILNREENGAQNDEPGG